VEKSRQQKLERDRQKEQIQNERVILQRQKELEHSCQWKQKEESVRKEYKIKKISPSFTFFISSLITINYYFVPKFE